MTTTDFTQLEEEALLNAQPTEPFGFVGLRSGRTHILRPEVEGHDPAGGAEVSGVIFTERTDMPSLEQLLEENEVAYAVLESAAPTTATVHVVTNGYAEPGPRFAWPRVAVATAIPTTVMVLGWVLLADSVADSTVQANPYTALSLILGGFVLFATLVLALRDRA